jgi:putative ABC transport system permease protein
MIKNYLLVAFRNIFRNKLFSTVNILGLAFGMCSALLIFLWVNDELNVDHFHPNVNRLYRVMENQRYSDGRVYTFEATPGPMVPILKDKYPEIERASRFTWNINGLFRYNDKAFYESGRFVDQDFLEMFGFAWKAGDMHTALKEKNTIVISEALAAKYFGNEEALGKIITVNDGTTYAVSGVMKDIPKNSSIQFDYLISFEAFWDENKSWLEPWDNNNIRSFVMLKENADVAGFQKKFANEIAAHVKENNVELFIQPFGEVYLYGDFENGQQEGGRIEYVRVFFIVAIFVLFIACINFTNLATAQATKRAKEVGLRKVIGAMPTQLFRQFMGESFLTVIISAVIAVAGCLLLLPLFNEITSKTLSLDLLDVKVVLIFSGIVFFTAFVAGIYPSFFIAEFKPVEVLKGQLKSGSRAGMFRKVLVVMQFSLSIILIISTVVVFRQMSFMQNRDIGFVRENLFYVWMQGDMQKNFETIRSRLLADPAIESVSASGQVPISIGNSTQGVEWAGKNPDDKILFTNMDVDFDFIQTMKMEMADGRSFDRTRITDSANYIVNEKAAEKFGFTNGTVDQDLTFWKEKGKIIGVVKDFNFGSLHSAIEPLIMRVQQSNVNCLLIRVKPNETEGGLRVTEKLWKEYAAAYPFKYTFIDQDWQDYYDAEAQRGKVFNVLSALSIIISCLGLFGLSAFSAERRTKELGIRKVLGASVPGLVQLMSKEFALLVLVASAIGCPAGWFLMEQWLQGYAYHISVGVVTVVAAALLCLFIALFTVSYHSVRVSRFNPTRSLRYE